MSPSTPTYKYPSNTVYRGNNHDELLTLQQQPSSFDVDGHVVMEKISDIVQEMVDMPMFVALLLVE